MLYEWTCGAIAVLLLIGQSVAAPASERIWSRDMSNEQVQEMIFEGKMPNDLDAAGRCKKGNFKFTTKFDFTQPENLKTGKWCHCEKMPDGSYQIICEPRN